jgi:hypothetical protein
MYKKIYYYIIIFSTALNVILKINTNKYYELGNNEGTIEKHYTRSQFDVCPKPLITVDEVSNTKKLLREIAKNISLLLGDQGYQRCACKSDCKTNKCKCKASGILCSGVVWTAHAGYTYAYLKSNIVVIWPMIIN